MKRGLTGLIALTLLCAAISGCGNSEGSTSSGNNTSGGSVSDNSTADGSDASNSSGVSDTSEDFEEDAAQINVLFWTLNTVPRDLEMVQDAINDYIRNKINTEIKLEIVDMGSYAQQVNLRVSSGEKLDLMVTLPGDTAHFNAMTSQNQLMGLSDLLDEYAPDLLDTVPSEWLSGTSVNGEIYSVPSYGDKATPLCFVCRTDILEKTGIAADSIQTAGDLTELFAKVKEVEPSMIPLTGGNKGILPAPYMIDSNGDFFSYDGLGEGNNSIIAIMPGDGTTISNRYETEEYRATNDWLHQWYESGYVDKDIANKDDTAQSVVQTGTAFGYFNMVSGGVLGSPSQTTSTGYDMTVIELDDSVITTGLLRKFTWAVPQCATEPEAAVKFLNLLYTDEELLNLITWGIEGTHYQTLEDGSIDFMDGEDSGSCGYYIGDITAILGNGFLAKVRAGQPLNYREECLKLNQAAEVSEYLGFGIDNTPVENTLTALTNVINELRPSFASGISASENLEGFISKLKAADVDAYVATMQEQLDAWIAENK